MKIIDLNTSLLSLISLAALSSTAFAQVAPYTGAGVEDEILSFSNGVDGLIEAPKTVAAFVSVTTYTEGTAVGGGWDLSSEGALSIGALGLEVASTRAKTEISSNKLTFGSVSTGLGQLASVGLPSLSWEASAEITGSDSWAISTGDTMSYEFDLGINNGLLNLGVSVFPNLTLDISDESGSLYTSSSVGQLLGITSLTSSSYSGSVDFNYTGDNGPLTVTWSGNQLLSAGLLSGAEDVMFEISNTDMVLTPVPEPSSAMLALLGVISLVGRRRR